MDARNLVLEIGESESAQDVQSRLDVAAKDGYFLVNVVGRLAFLRTSIAPTKFEKPSAKELPKEPVDGEAVTDIRNGMGKKARMTLQDLRIVGHLEKYDDAEWYRALDFLEKSGEFILEKTMIGRRKRIIVLAGKRPS